MTLGKPNITLSFPLPITPDTQSSLLPTKTNALNELNRKWGDWERQWVQSENLLASISKASARQRDKILSLVARACSGTFILFPTVYSSLWLLADTFRDFWLLGEACLYHIFILDDSQKTPRWISTTASVIISPFLHPYRLLMSKISRIPHTSNDVRGFVPVFNTALLLLIEAPLRHLILSSLSVSTMPLISSSLPSSSSSVATAAATAAVAFSSLTLKDNPGDFNASQSSLLQTVLKESVPVLLCWLGMWFNFKSGQLARQYRCVSEEEGRIITQNPASSSSSSPPYHTSDSLIISLSDNNKLNSIDNNINSSDSAPQKHLDSLTNKQSSIPILSILKQRFTLFNYSAMGSLCWILGAAAKADSVYSIGLPSIIQSLQNTHIGTWITNSSRVLLSSVPLLDSWLSPLLSLSNYKAPPPPLPNELLKILKGTDIVPDYIVTLLVSAPTISALGGLLAFYLC